MCGIVGFFGRKPPSKYSGTEKKDFMWQGLYMSALRGWDATGMAFVRDSKKEPLVYKRALAAPDFLASRLVDKLLGDADQCVAMLGHTRAATRGWISDDNAHPFQFKHITLVHNGHITNYRNIGPKLESEVDSAHVAAAFAEQPAIEVLPQLDGAFAFVWHDASDGTINFARNDGRPLHWATVEDWDGVAFASEFEMLGMLLARNKLKIRSNTLWYPTPKLLYKFNLDAIVAGKEVAFTTTPFPERKVHTREVSGTRDWGSRSDTRGDTKTGGTAATIKRVAYLVDTIGRISEKTATNITKQMVPRSARATDKATKKLRDLNFRFNAPWGCRTHEFAPYKENGELGCAIVEYTGANSGTLGEIHGILEEDYNLITDMPHPVIVRPYNVRNYTNKLQTVMATLDDETLAMMARKRAIIGAATTVQPLVKGPRGILISEASFKNMTQEGCSNCSGFINPAFADRVTWGDGVPTTVFCHECSDEGIPGMLKRYETDPQTAIN